MSKLIFYLAVVGLVCCADAVALPVGNDFLNLPFNFVGMRPAMLSPDAIKNIRPSDGGVYQGVSVQSHVVTDRDENGNPVKKLVSHYVFNDNGEPFEKTVTRIA